jgi:endonuclease/exonuclease/phosphatase family metal-dependent hydrolase
MTLRFRNNKQGGLLHIVNTHYDDQGVKARAESSILIRKYAKSWSDEGALQAEECAPFIVMGDFSESP